MKRVKTVRHAGGRQSGPGRFVFAEERRSLAAALAIDLQWFGDEADESQRTEEATETKIQRLREEGQVVKSQELVSALGLLLPALALVFLAPSMLRTSVEMLRFFLSRSTELDPAKDGIILAAFYSYLIRLAAPILAVAVAAAIFSNVVQTGFLFTTKPISPDFSKILPRFGQYLSRLFSVEGFFNFFKSIYKMAIIGIVAFVLIRGDLEKLTRLQTMNLWTSVGIVASLSARLLVFSAILLLLLSIPDYLFQRWRFMVHNRMTLQEAKEERRTYEGDPRVSARIRSRMMDLLTRTMYRNVPNADVVITNPTHLAIALEFHTERMETPMVTARGEDAAALRIRRIAEDSGVPVVENKPLARSLYASVQIGDFIPESFIGLIVEVYVRVHGINEERRRARSVGA
ncbi:MAG: flagellar biosynthesis protein FlhB [Treponema sp.]|jgi:flagellar biosynthetic protein FlhB|nr:flagellar biosynthesis protein FlhB [Treponema sp.]